MIAPNATSKFWQRLQGSSLATSTFASSFIMHVDEGEDIRYFLEEAMSLAGITDD